MAAGALMTVQAATVNVTPGKLADLLTGQDKTETSLTLTGSLDIRDFDALIENMPKLRTLDLSGVKVVAYNTVRPITSGISAHDADELPQNALFGLHLTELKLPADLKVIGEGALAGNDFETLELPSSLTTIGDNALYGCKQLKTLKLPAAVTSVGTYAFAGCTALSEVNMSATGVTALPPRLFATDAALAAAKLPASLKTIGEGCFAGTSALPAITLPASLTDIGAHAFTGSGLTSVSIPGSVTEVGDFAFAACPSLEKVTITNPDFVMGKGIFYSDPALKSIKANNITIMPDYFMAGSPNVDVAPLFATLEEIGAYALKDNLTQNIMLREHFTSLGDGAMENMTALTSIDARSLNSNIPALGKDVFAGINTSEVELHVAEKLEDEWKNAEQWKEFKIIAFGEVAVDEVYAEDAVKCRFSGTVLVLDSTMPMTRVEVFDTSGAKIADAAPNSESASIDTAHLSARIYIVKVSMPENKVAMFKLIR